MGSKISLFGGCACALLVACGGGGASSPVVSSVTGGTTIPADDANLTPVPTDLVTGPFKTLVAVGSVPGAVVALFPDGRAFLSPDGYNLAGGGATVAAYDGTTRIRQIAAVAGGVSVLFEDGKVYFSPDGSNLGGGGATVSAYAGTRKVALLVGVDQGVDAAFGDGGEAYYSPDGLNLGGGGNSIRISSGTVRISQIVALDTNPEVVVRLENGGAVFSPDNRNLSGGGLSVDAASGVNEKLKLLVAMGGGVMAQFASGATYLSATGKNLAGGANSLTLTAWKHLLDHGPFGPRDSSRGEQFNGRLWLSGGFRGIVGTESCFSTCSYFELWSSTDLTGSQWNPEPAFVTSSTPNPRDVDPVINNGIADAPVPEDFYDAYAPLAVWNNRLFAIGGTIWSSPDGVSWSRQNLSDGVTAAPGPLAVRATENSRAIALGAYLYLVQPDNGHIYRTQDSNAAQWEDLGAIPGFEPRCGSVAYGFQNQLWIQGGGACNYSKMFRDNWHSADGINWTQSPSPVRWSGRMWPCAAVDSNDGIVWLVGGYAPTDWVNVSTVAPRFAQNHSDVWFTFDGINWRQYKGDYGSGVGDEAEFEPRHAPTCYIDESAATKNLVVAAGTGASVADSTQASLMNSVRSLPLPSVAALN